MYGDVVGCTGVYWAVVGSAGGLGSPGGPGDLGDPGGPDGSGGWDCQDYQPR